MKKLLQMTTKYFATTEREADEIIEEIKEQTSGTIKDQGKKLYEHKDFGEYYETKVVEEHTTSKNILENGY